MLKRLIEVALPLKEVSEQSGKEKRQISALHMWWARRPLSTCRAVVFAAMIPDPDDAECPESFRSLVLSLLNRRQFAPKQEEGRIADDTPRNRCLEFTKHLVRWENSTNEEYIAIAQRLIAEAQPIFNEETKGEPPTVLDPFAGGGAIPLESLRLGCRAYAVDLNPVSQIIQRCTLAYPQQYGRPLPPQSTVPDYIRNGAGEKRAVLFDSSADSSDAYRLNPLAAEVWYWGNWIIEQLTLAIDDLYPVTDAQSIPVAYLWARTVKCKNPTCGSVFPLHRQVWLSKESRRGMALRPVYNTAPRSRTYEIVTVSSTAIPDEWATLRGSDAVCPSCKEISDSKYLRAEHAAHRIGEQLLAVVCKRRTGTGKTYRLPTEQDANAIETAESRLTELLKVGALDVPNEVISRNAPRRVSPPLYGIETFGELYNARQSLALGLTAQLVSKVHHALASRDTGLAEAVATYLACLVDKHADYNSRLTTWHYSNEQITHVFNRQAIPMVWDYCESSPLGGASGSLKVALEDILTYPPLCQPLRGQLPGDVVHGSARRLAFSSESFDAAITDPPYYDSVPYSDLSDYFYVWMKRSIGKVHQHLFSSPLTPKQEEITEQRPHKLLKKRRTQHDYERLMGEAFVEMARTLKPSGIACVMFAHKTTSAWEALIRALLGAGLSVTASWPLRTEMASRMVARGTAALASSVTLVCRKRPESAGTGLWDDVHQDLRAVAQERLTYFWSQDIRGADFFISAIGSALAVFGKYERVTKLSGEEVTVGQFLDEVRGLVTNYALAKILKTTHTANIDPESRFYVVWKWSYGEAKVPADESFKLAQALGMDTETMWDRSGVLEKSGENVLAVPVAKRMKIKDLGEPNADSTPASLIDVLHRMCVFRDKGDTEGMAEFLAHSGQGKNPTLWLVAQAVSEILPDGDKEKQLMQGLLNQREKLDQEPRLF
jgi:adenine-specific DNA methylase